MGGIREGDIKRGDQKWLVLVVFVGLVALSATVLYAASGAEIASWFTGRKITPETNLGPWGDSFGALNVSFSALAFIGILITLLLQNRTSREQTEDQHRQRFDASFFQLLNLQREARRELKFFNTEKFEKARAARSYATFSAATTGRMPQTDPIDPIAAADLEIHFQLLQVGSLDTCTKDELIFVYMRYIHSASEATIAPYFRIIYSILDRLRHDQILTQQEKVRYANLVRGQLSSAEVLLLGVNSLAPISADMQSLVTEFRMLKYLPNSSMRDLLKRFHHPQAFIGRDDPVPRHRKVISAFQDPRYQKMIAALHGERTSRRMSRKRLAELLCKPEAFVADYEDGKTALSIVEFVDVARALDRHPALFLRD